MNLFLFCIKRGNSKYHYYGIQVKVSSPLMKQMPFDGDLLFLTNTQHDFDNSSVHLAMSPNENVLSPLSKHMNDNNNNNDINSLREFSFSSDTSLISNELPSEITMDDIKIFQQTHDDYTTKLYQAFLRFQYDLIEKLIQQFWSLTNIHLSQIDDLTHSGIILIFFFFFFLIA